MATTLVSGEQLLELDGIPALVYARSAAAGRQTVLFLTGGGFLARVAYGHPGSEPRDFLDHWLAVHGLGLLAVSYPSDHPVFGHRALDVSLIEWARRLACLAANLSVQHPAPSPIVLVPWSMGGQAHLRDYPRSSRGRLRGRGMRLVVRDAPFPRTFRQMRPR